jgi:hypothetical protein
MCFASGDIVSLLHRRLELRQAARQSIPQVFLPTGLADIRESGIVIVVEQDAVLRLVSVAPAAEMPIGNLLAGHKCIQSRRQAIETSKSRRKDVEFNFSHQ